MKKETGIKYLVKVLFITKPAQKIHFTVRHPENALFLTGIAVTGTNVLKRGVEGIKLPDITGVLSLAIPEQGDVFYTQEVKSESGIFLDVVERRIQASFLRKDFGRSGKRYDYFDTCVRITDAAIEGYYEDAANSRGIIIGPKLIEPIGIIPVPAPSRILYRITLYLRYQLKEEKQTA